MIDIRYCDRGASVGNGYPIALACVAAAVWHSLEAKLPGADAIRDLYATTMGFAAITVGYATNAGKRAALNQLAVVCLTGADTPSLAASVRRSAQLWRSIGGDVRLQPPCHFFNRV